MIFAWPAILAALGRGLASGLGRVSSGAARAFGGGSRYAAMRNWSRAKRVGAGMLARGALRGGTSGAFSRLALAGMAWRRAKKRGKKLPRSVAGFLARDFVELGRSLTGLPAKLKSFQDGISESQGGLAQFSGTIAASQGQLTADRFRRSAQYARSVADSESFKNRGRSKLEEALLPYAELGAKITNYIGGLVDRTLAGALDVTRNALVDKPFTFGQKIRDLFTGEFKRLAEAERFNREQQEKWERDLAAMPPDKRRELQRRIDATEIGPAEWWKGNIPQHEMPLTQIVSDIAHGVYHTRKYPPLKPIDGGPRVGF